MSKEKFIYNSARTAGCLLLLATVPHVTLGMAEILTEIKIGGISQSMISTVKNLWVVSSMTLPLSGIWVLFLAKDLKRLQRRAWWQALLIGLVYTGGSIGAMAWTSIQIHLLLFCLVGLLLLLPQLRWAGSFSSTGNPPAA